MSDALSEETNDAVHDTVHESSGNVFADLDLPHEAEDMLKVELARVIAATIRRRRLTQARAAQLVGTDQAKVSSILRGKLKEFSTDRLLKFLLRLGRDIDITVSNTTKDGPGHLKFHQVA